MAEYSVQEIQIGKLLLDVSNPRHEILEGQTETLREIILDQKGKLVKLAYDIVDNGLNPADLTIVTPSTDEKDLYIVLEGNRRLAALKLLGDPAMAALGVGAKDVNALKSCSERYNDNPISHLRCVVFNKREDAVHWIELRHTGENEGRGIVNWGAKEKARFSQLQGRPSPALQVVEFVRKNASLGKEGKEALKKPNISSTKRLINDPYVRETLGISISDGFVATNLAPEEVINGLTRLVMDVATESISVNHIRFKSDRASYINEFTEEDLPSTKAKPVETWKLQSQTVPVKPRVAPSKRALGTAKGRKSVKLSTSRTALIPPTCVLRIKPRPRINKIYRELRGLEVKGFENCCAITFRVFLELSVDEYMKTKSITVHENDKLAGKIKKVANYIQSSRLMSQDELKPIRVACSTRDNLVSTNTLNAYVHNPNLDPKADDLKLTWDGFEKFFKTIWP